jgi:hypothetical protein
MTRSLKPTRPSSFDLGFEHGAEADEDPSACEMNSRVPEYKLGYVLGRSYQEAVRNASHIALAIVAGELGVRFGVGKSELLDALRIPATHERHIHDAYSGAGASDECR